jgi:SAM-dependent methyltransferase
VNSFAGVRRIVRFNWPFYAAAFVVTVAVVAAFVGGWLPPALGLPALVGLALANGWLVLSLVVSHVVYDRSAVPRGDWLPAGPPRRVVVLHVGHDEVSAAVARRLPDAELTRVDVFDPARVGSPSLARARAVAERDGARTARLDQLPFADGSIDVVVCAFAAHEVRDDAPRATLLREAGRIAGSTGRVLVLEHLRDAWNVFAYGPGAWHFLPRRTWLSTFAAAGLAVVDERPVTPWVRRFELRTAPMTTEP